MIYAKYVKRPLDFLISFFAIILFGPIIIILSILGAVKVKGNPFFTQERPGKNEKVFNE